MGKAVSLAAQHAEAVHKPFAIVPLDGSNSSQIASTDVEHQNIAPLTLLVHALASMRAGGMLLHPSEWAAYQAAEHGR